MHALDSHTPFMNEPEFETSNEHHSSAPNTSQSVVVSLPLCLRTNGRILDNERELYFRDQQVHTNLIKDDTARQAVERCDGRSEEVTRRGT